MRSPFPRSDFRATWLRRPGLWAWLIGVVVCLLAGGLLSTSDGASRRLLRIGGRIVNQAVTNPNRTVVICGALVLLAWLIVVVAMVFDRRESRPTK